MTTTALQAPHRRRMTSLRATALLGGVLYLITFAASIPAAAVLLTPVVTDPLYVLGAGADTQVVVGCLLDIVNALAAIGTAVVLFPVVKRQNETLALGFVASRILEAAIIFVGIVSLLAVVALRQQVAAGGDLDPDAAVAVGSALVAVRDATFVLGPGMAAANALLLGTLMYRSRLVPRVIPLMGLVGAPLLLASNTATLLGVNETVSVLSALALPGIFFWELSLGLYLTVKGFRPSPITADLVEPVAAAEVTR